MEEEDGKWRKETESKENGEIINGKKLFWKKRKRRSRKDKKEKVRMK